MSEPLLKVENLRIELTTRAGVAPVIDNLSFELGHGENISFVGESGCGKSMTALAIMGSLPARHLERIVPDATLGIRDAHGIQQLGRHIPCRPF